MVGPGLARVAGALPAFEGDEGGFGVFGKLVHQQRQVAGGAGLAAVFFMVYHQHGDGELVNRHFGYGAAVAVGQDAGRQYHAHALEAVR